LEDVATRRATTPGTTGWWRSSPTGEGWHNNHHHYQSAANQGFRWWEIDVTYYLLRLLALLGLVWDIRRPPRDVIEDRRRSMPRSVLLTADDPVQQEA
jgi:stearoyl-CoA desaturase (delta-9 desaturase)